MTPQHHRSFIIDYAVMPPRDSNDDDDDENEDEDEQEEEGEDEPPVMREPDEE